MESRTTLCGSLLALVLLAFFMPFFELRCGEPQSTAAGWQVALGRLEGQDEVKASGPAVRQPWLLAVPLIAAAGAAAAFLALRAPPVRARRLLRGAAAAGPALVALLAASHLRLQHQVPGLVRDLVAQGSVGQEAAKLIQVQPQLGWYVALLAAAAASLLARSVRVPEPAQPAAAADTGAG